MIRPLASLALMLVAFSVASAAAVAQDVTVARYATALASANARLSATARYELADRLLMLASYYRLDPALLIALVTVESSWHAGAVSPVGALGYGQLMPGTAAGLRVDALEPYENLDGTARYLRRMLMHFAARSARNQVALAVASYNAGPAAVDRYGGIPPYRETQSYVVNVLHWRDRYARALYGAPAIRVAAYTLPPATTQVALTTVPVRTVHRALPRAHPHPRPRAHAVIVASVKPAPVHHRRSPYLDATDPNAYETPAPHTARGLRGLFARMFHHRDTQGGEVAETMSETSFSAPPP